MITAAAVGFIYLYVVPQLRSSLTAEKLQRLEQVAGAQSRPARRRRWTAGASQAAAAGARCARSTSAPGSRVTVLGVRAGAGGPEPAFVIADSRARARPRSRRATRPPPRPRVGGTVASAVEGVGGRPRRARRRCRSRPGGEPRWVAVFSTDLGDVDDNVALIRRQILIAGLIALLAALGAGWLVAGAHARRLRRLERGRGEGRPRRLLDPDPGRLQRRGRPARDHASTRCRSASRSSTAPARSSSPTRRTSCGRRSSRSSGFVELLDDEDPDPEARAEFVARRCASRSTG